MHIKLIALLSLSLSQTVLYGAAAEPEVTVVGDPEKMIPAIERALAKDDFTTSGDLMAAYWIRVRLDSACCADASTQAAMDQLTIRAMANPKYSEFSRRATRDQLREHYVSAGKQIEKALNDKTLSSPEWVAKYGLNKYLRALAPAGTAVPTDKALFGEPASWLARRQAALAKIRAEWAAPATGK